MEILIILYYLFSLLFMFAYNSDKLKEKGAYLVIPLFCWALLPLCLGLGYRQKRERLESILEQLESKNRYY
jgi:hypothetical protein